jgi:pectate lyase-like protein
MTTTTAATQIRLNAVDLIQSTGAPTGGVAAAIGSLFLRSDIGQLWQKTGAADIAWSQLVQSFAWYSVKDYGAVGDNSTDDTAAVQAAIDACATAGGGVVYFPAGIYRVTQLTLNTQNNVQLVGQGASSSLRWTFNAATLAGSMLNITGSSRQKILNMKFDGAGLTNPAASRDNHLIRLGDDAVATQIMNCTFTGMVAASGDGVHIVGTAGHLVSRTWVSQNTFDGCSRFGVGVEQGYEYLWVNENYFTNCETDIGIVATADVNGASVVIYGNEINHTGTTRHALRLEGGATTLITRLVVAENVILGGFATINRAKHVVFHGNVETSGAFASADPVVRVFGAVSYLTMNSNIVVRDSGANAGPVITVEKSTDSPTIWRAGANILANDKAGGGFLTVVDSTKFTVGGNVCVSADATGTVHGFDIQAVTVNVTDVLIGPANQMSTLAGSMDSCVRLFSNGANIVDVSVVGNQGDNTDYGLWAELAGGGAFSGNLMYGTNNFDSTVGDINEVGVTIRPRIGLNAGTFGANMYRGAGSPEGVVTARIGSIYLRTDGGQATTIYVKESGTGNTGWVGIGGQVLQFGTGDAGTAATALFMGTGWIATATATEVQVAVTRPGTVRNLRIRVGAAGTDNQLVTYTVRKNGVDTVLTTSLANDANGNASDTTHSFTVVAGDLISVGFTKAAIVAAGQTNLTASMELA